MSGLVTIGDFSKMTYLTVKALRHYHEIGLLEPVTVDAQNGYRMYAPEQVAVAQSIRRFRELEMPTDEIRTVLTATDDDARNAVIVGHLDRMESRLVETQSTISALRVLLSGDAPATEITYRTLTPTFALAISEHVAFDDAEAWCEAVYEEMHALIESLDGTASGPDGALYDDQFFQDGEGVVTAFVPIADDIATRGRITAIEVPGFHAAVAVHAGAFDTLDQTYSALGTQVTEAGIGATGPMREHYLDDETIEVCWPITGLPSA